MPKNKHCQGAPIWASQNFLTGGAEIRRLIALSDISKNDRVLEIGPGKGHISRELVKRCQSLTAVELDRRLCEGLRERFAGEERFRLIEGDFFRTALPRGEYKVFANLPFGGSSAVIWRLAGEGRPPEGAWLIVELGAAKRFAGDGLSGWRLRPFFKVRVAARISRQQFHPAPGVDAALLEIKKRREPHLPWERQREFWEFLERGWGNGARELLTPRQIAAALRLEGLPPAARDGNMEYVQWLCLFRCWDRFYGQGGR